MHKPDLNFQYQHLASSATPFTSLLYGDDVSKTVSDIDSVNKVGNKIRRFKFGYIPRGYFRRGRGRPGFRGSRGRGRGGKLRGFGRGASSFQRNYDQSSDLVENVESKNYKNYNSRSQKN